MITNWAGNLTYSTTNLHEATSKGEIGEWVRARNRLKVLGTRHCFNDIADSREGFLSVAALDREIALNKEASTVTTGGGMRYGELAVFLHDNGYALENLASLPHISVAGGVATATHGSGVRNGNLSSAVVGMEFVTAAGEIVQLIRHRDAWFQGAVVHLGGIGVVTRLELRVQPAYDVRQYVYENLPMDVLQRHFDAIMSSGYSVSLFTSWSSRNIEEVWIKSVADGFSAPVEFFGARAATRHLHPIRDMPAENCTPQLGVAGPWHERLPHFRMGFMPSSGRELQSEYFVPREHSYEAIMAVGKLHERISPHLLITEIRSIAADDLWMSPCGQGDSTAIHFTWKPEWEAVRLLLPQIEEALAPFRARPHWGKLFSMGHVQLRALYPRMDEFRELLCGYDPFGKFRNAFLNRVIFGD